jgi:hypothetical protein
MMQDAGCQMPDARCWLLDTRCWILDTSEWIIIMKLLFPFNLFFLLSLPSLLGLPCALCLVPCAFSRYLALYAPDYCN